MAADAAPDLVVLDLGLPDVPGETVARELRSMSPVPILMLTAKAAEEDRIRGLELGADDYVTKPFSPRELVLRVQAILRRGGPAAAAQGVASYGGGVLVIDEPRRTVTVRARKPSSPHGVGILGTLATVPGRVYSRFELINKVRGYEFEGYERTVDSHVKNLRRKIEDDQANPAIILTCSAAATGSGCRAMTDASPPEPRPRRRPRPGPPAPPRDPGGGHRGSTLGLRLAFAFLGVALAAVALIAVLTAVFSEVDVSSLASRERNELAGAFAVAAGSAWQQNQSWAGANLTPVTAPAEQIGVQLQVRDADGRLVAATSGFAAAADPTTSAPVLVRGHREGSVLVKLTASGLGGADAVLRTALLRAIAGPPGSPPCSHSSRALGSPGGSPAPSPADRGDPGDGQRRPLRARGRDQGAW